MTVIYLHSWVIVYTVIYRNIHGHINDDAMTSESEIWVIRISLLDFSWTEDEKMKREIDRSRSVSKSFDDRPDKRALIIDSNYWNLRAPRLVTFSCIPIFAVPSDPRRRSSLRYEIHTHILQNVYFEFAKVDMDKHNLLQKSE